MLIFQFPFTLRQAKEMRLTVLFSVVVLGSIIDAQCPQGWIFVESRCFGLLTGHCSAGEGRPVSIHSVTQNQAVVRLMNDNSISTVRTGGGSSQRSSGFHVTWVDGSPMDYTNYEGGASGPSSAGCIVVASSGLWSTVRECPPKIVCAFEASAVTTPVTLPTPTTTSVPQTTPSTTQPTTAQLTTALPTTTQPTTSQLSTSVPSTVLQSTALATTANPPTVQPTTVPVTQSPPIATSVPVTQPIQPTALVGFDVLTTVSVIQYSLRPIVLPVTQNSPQGVIEVLAQPSAAGCSSASDGAAVLSGVCTSLNCSIIPSPLFYAAGSRRYCLYWRSVSWTIWSPTNSIVVVAPFRVEPASLRRTSDLATPQYPAMTFESDESKSTMEQYFFFTCGIVGGEAESSSQFSLYEITAVDFYIAPSCPSATNVPVISAVDWSQQRPGYRIAISSSALETAFGMTAQPKLCVTYGSGQPVAEVTTLQVRPQFAIANVGSVMPDRNNVASVLIPYLSGLTTSRALDTLEVRIYTISLLSRQTCSGADADGTDFSLGLLRDVDGSGLTAIVPVSPRADRVLLCLFKKSSRSNFAFQSTAQEPVAPTVVRSMSTIVPAVSPPGVATVSFVNGARGFIDLASILKGTALSSVVAYDGTPVQFVPCDGSSLENRCRNVRVGATSVQLTGGKLPIRARFDVDDAFVTTRCLCTVQYGLDNTPETTDLKVNLAIQRTNCSSSTSSFFQVGAGSFCGQDTPVSVGTEFVITTPPSIQQVRYAIIDRQSSCSTFSGNMTTLVPTGGTTFNVKQWLIGADAGSMRLCFAPVLSADNSYLLSQLDIDIRADPVVPAPDAPTNVTDIASPSCYFWRRSAKLRLPCTSSSVLLKCQNTVLRDSVVNVVDASDGASMWKQAKIAYDGTDGALVIQTRSEAIQSSCHFTAALDEVTLHCQTSRYHFHLAIAFHSLALSGSTPNPLWVTGSRPEVRQDAIDFLFALPGAPVAFAPAGSSSCGAIADIPSIYLQAPLVFPALPSSTTAYFLCVVVPLTGSMTRVENIVSNENAIVATSNEGASGTFGVQCEEAFLNRSSCILYDTQVADLRLMCRQSCSALALSSGSCGNGSIVWQSSGTDNRIRSADVPVSDAPLAFCTRVAGTWTRVTANAVLGRNFLRRPLDLLEVDSLRTVVLPLNSHVMVTLTLTEALGPVRRLAFHLANKNTLATCDPDLLLITVVVSSATIGYPVAYLPVEGTRISNATILRAGQSTSASVIEGSLCLSAMLDGPYFKPATAKIRFSSVGSPLLEGKYIVVWYAKDPSYSGSEVEFNTTLGESTLKGDVANYLQGSPDGLEVRAISRRTYRLFIPAASVGGTQQSSIATQQVYNAIISGTLRLSNVALEWRPAQVAGYFITNQSQVASMQPFILAVVPTSQPVAQPPIGDSSLGGRGWYAVLLIIVLPGLVGLLLYAAKRRQPSPNFEPKDEAKGGDTMTEIAEGSATPSPSSPPPRRPVENAAAFFAQGTPAKQVAKVANTNETDENPLYDDDQGSFAMVAAGRSNTRVVGQPPAKEVASVGKTTSSVDDAAQKEASSQEEAPKKAAASPTAPPEEEERDPLAASSDEDNGEF